MYAVSLVVFGVVLVCLGFLLSFKLSKVTCLEFMVSRFNSFIDKCISTSYINEDDCDYVLRHRAELFINPTKYDYMIAVDRGLSEDTSTLDSVFYARLLGIHKEIKCVKLSLVKSDSCYYLKRVY